MKLENTSQSPGMAPVRRMNLTGVVCPMNFVRTKLALEELHQGEVLEVLLDAGEPMRNVPRSVQEEGHEIVKAVPSGDQFAVYIRKC